MPCHPVAQLIDSDLLLTDSPPRARDADITDAGDGDSGAAASATSARVRLSVVVVVLEEADSVGRWRGILHLHGEPGAGEDGAALAEGVGNLVRVHGIEGGTDADALLLGGLIDDNELGLLGLGDVAEEGQAVLVLGLGWRRLLGLRGNGMGVVGHWCSGIVHRGSHGGTAYRRVWWVTTGVAGEDVALSDVLRRAMGDLVVFGGVRSIT